MTNPEDNLINTEALAKLTGTSKSYWEKMRSRGEGPRYFKRRGLVLYRRADVDAWLAARVVSTQEDV